MPCDKKKKDTMVGPFLQNGVSLINLKAHAQKAQSLPESPGGTRGVWALKKWTRFSSTAIAAAAAAASFF